MQRRREEATGARERNAVPRSADTARSCRTCATVIDHAHVRCASVPHVRRRAAMRELPLTLGARTRMIVMERTARTVSDGQREKMARKHTSEESRHRGLRPAMIGVRDVGGERQDAAGIESQQACKKSRLTRHVQPFPEVLLHVLLNVEPARRGRCAESARVERAQSDRSPNGVGAGATSTPPLGTRLCALGRWGMSATGHLRRDYKSA